MIAECARNGSNILNSQNGTILILSANPQGTPKRRLNEEMREIEEGLERARQRDRSFFS